MGLRSRIKQFFGIPEVGTAGANGSPFIEYQGAPDTRANVLYDRYEGIVYAAVNAKAQSIAAAEYKMFRPNTAGEMQEVKTHPFMKLLENPHNGFSKFELMLGTASFYEIAGEAFWYFALGEQTGLPKEIYLMHPQKTKIIIDKVTGAVIGYEYMKTTTDKIVLDPNEVLHFKTFNPDNPYRGYGTIQAALTYIETEQFSSKFTRNFFKNNATPAGIVTVNTADKAEFDSFKRRWNERYSGVDKAGKVAFIRGQEVGFQKLSMGLNEIDITALKNLSEDTILKMFRVPKALLGFADAQGLGRASVETLEYIFAKYVIEPELKSFDDTLQTAVDRFYKGQGLHIEHINTVPEDRLTMLQEQQAGVDIWITRNEIRESRGLATITGGDELYASLQQLPIASTESPTTRSIKIKMKAQPVEKAVETVEKQSNAKNERFRLQLAAIQATAEQKATLEFRKFLKRQQRKVVASLTPQKSYFVVSEEGDDLIEAIYPVIEDLSGKSGRISFDFAGGNGDDFVLTDSGKAELKRRIGLMAENYNKETLNALEKTLREGFEAGENLRQLKARVNDIYKDANGYRAERVVRTETLFASQAGSEMAYKEIGFYTEKVWYANPDCCAFCSEMDGKTVGLDDSFASIGDIMEVNGASLSIDYDTVETPPLHPNCACIILPAGEA